VPSGGVGAGEVTLLGRPCSVLGWLGMGLWWSCPLMPVLDCRGVVVDGVDEGNPPVDWPAPPVPISVPGVPGSGAVGETGGVAGGVVTSVALGGMFSRVFFSCSCAQPKIPAAANIPAITSVPLSELMVLLSGSVLLNSGSLES
jgi:hypothetical protein